MENEEKSVATLDAEMVERFKRKFNYFTTEEVNDIHNQATYDYLHGNKNVGKYLRGILRYFNRCNWPKWDGSRMSWYKHKLFKQGKL